MNFLVFNESAVFQILILTLIIGISPFKREVYDCSFSSELKLLIGFAILYLLAIALDNPAPIGLLLGPMLFRLFCSLTESGKMSRRNFHLHQLPFYLMAVLAFFNFEFYHHVYLPAMAISVSGYSLFFVFAKKRLAAELDITSKHLFDLLVVLALAVSPLLFMFALNPYVILNWGFALERLIYLILGLTVLLVITYLVVNRKDRQILSTYTDQNATRCEAEITATSKISELLKERQLYLDPQLSLAKFAAEAGLPKHKCTRLLQIEEGKTFYQLLAEYRIDHAKKLLAQDKLEVLTIESIAESCGFNSKASFNRYFRELSGYTPSAYRKSLDRQ